MNGRTFVKRTLFGVLIAIGMVFWIVVLINADPKGPFPVCLAIAIAALYLGAVVSTWSKLAIEAVKANTAALDAHRALMQGIADNTILTAQEVNALRRAVTRQTVS